MSALPTKYVTIAAILLALPAVGFGDEAPASTAPIGIDPAERILSLEAEYEIHRDGIVTFEQRFRLGVAGVAVTRGPILNYLTVFEGPGGLILDNKTEIVSISRDGEAEPFRIEERDGFITLYLGAADHELEKRAHDYIVRGRMEADWRKGEGEFSTVFDLVSFLPRLPIDSAKATIRLPSGVPVSRYTPGLTGVDPEAEKHGPAYRSEQIDHLLTVHTTAPLGEDRSFFVNLAWPSATFAMKSQWLKVIREHPRLPLAGFSTFLLAWALVLLLVRIAGRRIE